MKYIMILLFCVFPFMGKAQNNKKTEVFYKYQKAYFPLVSPKNVADIYFNKSDAEVVKIAANIFREDVCLLSGKSPNVKGDSKIESDYPIIMGTIGKSAMIDELIANKKIAANNVQGKWETFSIAVVEKPFKNVKQAVIVYGSDPRGTAFGVFELSRMMGVSPFVWWADVKPAHHNEIYISPGSNVVGPPTVKYRGVFLNDEDWGLRPWAAKKMDPDKKDIGPKTYEKVFELLLRLKANYIWPAMHPGTKAFWYYKENPEIARKYDIIMGSSHHEPMLRDTEFEWNENFKEEYGKDHGDWRYDTNRDEIYTFFDDRVKESVKNPAIYTVGMRATKDGAMSGPSTTAGKVKILEEVIHDQREILEKRLGKPASEIPQVFCPYKEVLPLYRAGMKLPEDISITWVDDNHGNIRQLPNPNEQNRSGGNGVYYHFSYWGTPQDYLWLSSTSPVLAAYEMNKAYHYNAKRMWVFNVGDLKPAELEMQFAMDMAWDIKKWPATKAHEYPLYWAKEIFGEVLAKPIADIKAKYYELAASGKPEHINRLDFTEPEAKERIKAYNDLYAAADNLQNSIPDRLRDAYFELILYPVKGAALMNKKILYKKWSLESSLTAAQQKEYVEMSQKAYDEIQTLTTHYNKEIGNGKWDGIMDAHPRNIDMFNAPDKLKVSPFIKSDVNAYVVPAASYQHKSIPPGYKIETLEGLGMSGKGITVAPFLKKSYQKEELSKAPFVTYKVKLQEGENQILIKCVPSFKINENFDLRYGIQLNEQSIQVVDLSSLAETKPWEKNVLRGFTQGETLFKIDKAGEVELKIYLPDPGLVISEIEIKNGQL